MARLRVAGLKRPPSQPQWPTLFLRWSEAISRYHDPRGVDAVGWGGVASDVVVAAAPKVPEAGAVLAAEVRDEPTTFLGEAERVGGCGLASCHRRGLVGRPGQRSRSSVARMYGCMGRSSARTVKEL